MKEPKAMKEVHDAMGKLYEEIKHLSPEEQVEEIKKEADELLHKYNAKIKHIKRLTLARV